MKCFRVLSILVISVASLVWASGASAGWYAGNVRSSAFGVKARIFTPASAPNIVWVTPPGVSGESSWVSQVSGNGWAQAGWHYYPFLGYASAKSYTEGNVAGINYQKNYGDQPWGTYVVYKVESIGGNCWRASFPAIGDGDAWCGIEAPPSQMQAMLEVHGSSSNSADTSFRKAQYKKADGTWVNFNEANWYENPPYRILDKTFLFKWNSVGP